jgi:hypothetical protein
MPDDLPLATQLRLQNSTGPDPERKAGLAKALTLSKPLAMELCTSSVGSKKQNESVYTVLPPSLRVFQKVSARTPDQRFVTSLVTLRLAGCLRAVTIFDQNVNAFLSLSTCSVPFGDVDVLLLLNQFPAQVLKHVIPKRVECWNFSWANGWKSHGFCDVPG